MHQQLRQPAVSAVTTTAREKRPLVIRDPTTKTIVRLSEDLEKTNVPDGVPPAPVAPEESPPTKNTGDHTVERSPPVPKPLIPLEELQDIVAKVDPVVKEETVPEVSVQVESEPEVQQNDLGQRASDTDAVAVESKVAQLLGEATDVESSAVSDEGEEDDLTRRVYSRAFLLKCKESPITKYPPEDFRNRNMNRPAQRVIRLNTTITVKRVEGAFVPSRLQKKEADGTGHKQLSTELNVILNRLSDANLTETIADVRKLTFSSPDDLQLLAKLIFQKFNVQGSDNLEVMVIQQTQELFNTPLDTLIAELNANIDSKIETAKDESIKKILRENRETNILKRTEAYYGNIAFLAELFLCRLFSPKSMLQCLRKLKDSAAPESLTSLITLLQTCGPELEQQSKNQLDECFAKLNSVLKSDKIPAHQLYKIQELIELRARGWKKLDPTQMAPSPAEALSRRSTDEKMRRPHLPTAMEAKRKPAQSVNPLMPSSLAVTQQPYDSRKLGPAFANWCQGSGKISKTPAEDGSHAGEAGLLSGATNRSREASPRVGGLQGAWAARASNNAKPREDYSVVLERNRCKARKIVDELRNGEEDSGSVLQELPEMDRCAVLHALLELSMDNDERLRDSIGKLLAELLMKNQISLSFLETGCKMFFEKCDEDFLEDYPKGWEYIAQILQHLIKSDGDHFAAVLSILKHLQSDGRGATVLAHCLRLSAKRMGEENLAAKWRARRLDWKNLGVQGDVGAFIEKHMITFTISPNASERMKQLAELCKNSSTAMEEIMAFFKQFSTVPPNFVRSCVETMISNSTDHPQVGR
ncbi:unnamed protein product [Echinostoma caproni]|uniref:MI domain-containing protein n=1 Tax=Echinostoma caproni TaxID=27848 RepID=A0A183AR39_9TREM|nr:unnamed protein product [Echinostoma caproni]